ncbi:MAG: bifunctional 23S rRNA (guanine(2069)-N(7))-methyltransferase RlmK/23S rRNA (guanine(2445)-N(2))-methyltransferase RlmL [Aliiglaciecola sp.]
MTMLDITVTTSRGLDDLLLQELSEFFPDTTMATRPGQVYFQGTQTQMYFICMWSRLANRVLLKVAEGKVDSGEDLYRIADTVSWPQNFAVDDTFVVDFVGTNRTVNNTQFGSLKIKDAIVDQFSSHFGKRPSVNKASPNIRIQGRVRRELLSIYIDISGQSLHQRQYRQQTGQAPVKEHIAAAMLMRSGWVKNQQAPLFDPMCGSGTVAIEAALIASAKAPGLDRTHWGFDHWKCHDAQLWDDIKQTAKSTIKVPECEIFANDIDKRVLNFAKQNADVAGVFEHIKFFNSDATKLQLDAHDGFIVSNPPYGERLSELTELLPVFQRWGLHLKSHFKGWKLGLLTGNRDILKQLKFVSKKAYKLMNGPIECQFVNYDLNDKNCEIKPSVEINNDFANRLGKNLKGLQKWLKNQDTNCYRIYDADLPEYNVAIDKYEDWIVVQEYQAPKDVPEEKARKRLHDVLLSLPSVTGVDDGQIIVKTRAQQKGSKQYQKVAEKQVKLEVYENGAKFLVNLSDYLDTGLFLDHRITRQIVQQKAKNKDVLNLFAYTGSVSVHAGLGGARSVTTVDMSKTYLQWARQNVQLNNLANAHEFIQADCTTWLATHDKRYDLIFIDPPSFSNSKRMESTWDVQRDHVKLLLDAKKRLEAGGEIIFSNNLRSFKLDQQALEDTGFIVTDLCKKTLPEDFKRNPKIHHCWLLVLGR